MKIEARGEKTVVTVPAHCNLAMLPLLLMIPSYGVGMSVFAGPPLLTRLNSPDSILLIVSWAVPYLLMLTVAVLLFLYFVRGREVLTIDREHLVHRYHLSRHIGYERRFDLSRMKNLRGVSPSAFWKWNWQYSALERFGIRNGAFAFDYADGDCRFTVYLGSNLTRAEGWHLTEIVNEKRA